MIKLKYLPLIILFCTCFYVPVSAQLKECDECTFNVNSQEEKAAIRKLYRHYMVAIGWTPNTSPLYKWTYRFPENLVVGKSPEGFNPKRLYVKGGIVDQEFFELLETLPQITNLVFLPCEFTKDVHIPDAVIQRLSHLGFMADPFSNYTRSNADLGALSYPAGLWEQLPKSNISRLELGKISDEQLKSVTQMPLLTALLLTGFKDKQSILLSPLKNKLILLGLHCNDLSAASAKQILTFSELKSLVIYDSPIHSDFLRTLSSSKLLFFFFRSTTPLKEGDITQFSEWKDLRIVGFSFYDLSQSSKEELTKLLQIKKIRYRKTLPPFLLEDEGLCTGK